MFCIVAFIHLTHRPNEGDKGAAITLFPGIGIGWGLIENLIAHMVFDQIPPRPILLVAPKDPSPHAFQPVGRMNLVRSSLFDEFDQLLPLSPKRPAGKRL